MGGGLDLFMSPEHQDPIRSGERLEGVGQGGGCAAARVHSSGFVAG